MNQLRVLLADDHVLMLNALKRLLQPLCTVVGIATDGRSLIDLAERLLPDIIIADIYMPNMNGLDACKMINSTVGSKIIILTVMEDPETAAEAIRGGALGYVVKKNAFAELFKAIQTVALGHPYISPSVNNAPMNVTIATTGSHEREEWLSNQQREIS
jgi:DNA-binding NarL/FixJ family response regulator